MDLSASEAARAPAPAGTVRPWPWPRVVAWFLLGAAAGSGLLLLAGLQDTGSLRLDAATATTPTTAVGVAALCYLAAAVTGVRWVSWAAVPVASALPFLAEALDVPRWVAFAVVGVVLVGAGIVARRTAATWPQTLAMVGYLGVAVVALYLAPRVGLALAGATLAAHAAWDLVHYRRDVVVNRSLAVWCMGLDLFIGAVCVVLAIRG